MSEQSSLEGWKPKGQKGEILSGDQIAALIAAGLVALHLAIRYRNGK